MSLSAAADAAAQEETGYRIELLILRNLDTVAEPKLVAELPDLSQALDLEERQAAEEAISEDPFYPGPPDAELLPPVGPSPDVEIPWADIHLVGERSEQMNSVWRNLRLSAEFRPEAFLAWEQPAEEPFPLLRVHNQEILLVDDPFEMMRPLRPVPDEDPEEGGRQWSGYVFNYQPDSGGLVLGQLPEPRYHYVLDGTVRLRRSRFLHFELDLGYFLPLPAGLSGIAGPPLLAEFQGFPEYELRQSRQVRTGRMEYFDSPVLGALVWITEFEYPEEEAPE